MKVGSLFTGYGGLDHAARAVFGGELAWVSDNHPSAMKLLAHRHPDVPNLGDITAIDWVQVEPVDLLAAGFPCQDISNAGLRAGIEGARSGLWFHVADAVRVLRPRHVVLENVSALLVRGLDRVQSDLASLGYDLRWCCLRASDVGAAHRRERWFGYATPSGSDSTRWQGVEPEGRRVLSSWGAAAHAYRDGVRQQPVGQSRSGGEAFVVELGAHVEWGQFEPAIRRWEAVLGRPAPEPTELSGAYLRMLRRRLERRDKRPVGLRGSLRPVRVLSPRFVEWLMGLEPGWVTDVPALSRTEQLRLLGNGVVPQQGVAALRWLVGHASGVEAA